ncbi:MAG TPA: LytR C-terminal domain-containing protein [Acidimicrobiia bacterium]|nr:LytR C-terminal domain-containing protein [Acidimicrobiia bacterium]HLF60151.1 LytR C-terminal domain-containing protein [Acidimicrobiia bacterium]
MSGKGKHASKSSGAFYRDLLIMMVGILMVGAAVFLLLFIWAGDPVTNAGETTTTMSPVTTGVEASTTTAPATTTTTQTSTTPATVPLRPPGEVRVMVFNSITLSGAAGRFTQELADAGYLALPADDLDPEYDPSRIWYRDGFSAEANVLLALLPGAMVEPLPDPDMAPGADLVVVLGVGYEE